MTEHQPHHQVDSNTTIATHFPFHYGWIIVVAGLLSVIGGLGIGRFALGMLLPSMRTDLGLDYAQLGFTGTGNFIGYLLAVLASGSLVARLGARRIIFAALLTIGVTMMLISASNNFYVVLLLYVVTGMGSGAANVPMMGLVSRWFARRLRGRAAGFIVIGSGFGIMGSGLLIPAVNAHWGAGGWRVSWLILGLTVMTIALICGALLRNDPREVGSTPCGDSGDSTGGDNLAAGGDPASRRRILAHLGGIYFLFGFTYVIYATFIVTTLVQDHGFSEAVAGQFWFWVGFLSLFSGPLFGWLSDHAGRRTGLAVVFTMHATAYLLVGLALPGPFLYLSIALFGLAAWSIPGIMAAAVGDYMGARYAVAAIGSITFIFGIGQIAGPALAGILAESSGSFASSYLLAAGLASGALVLSLLLKPPPQR
jgi:MFS family permease